MQQRKQKAWMKLKEFKKVLSRKLSMSLMMKNDGDDIHPVDDTQGESTADAPIISGTISRKSAI